MPSCNGWSLVSQVVSPAALDCFSQKPKAENRRPPDFVSHQERLLAKSRRNKKDYAYHPAVPSGPLAEQLMVFRLSPGPESGGCEVNLI